MATTRIPDAPARDRRRPTSSLPDARRHDRGRWSELDRVAWHARRLRLQPLPVRQARRRRPSPRAAQRWIGRRRRRSSAINSNDAEQYPEDCPEHDGRAGRRHWGWDFPYLVDADQTAALGLRRGVHAGLLPLRRLPARSCTRGRFDGSTPGNNVPLTGDELGRQPSTPLVRPASALSTRPAARASAAASSGSRATNPALTTLSLRRPAQDEAQRGRSTGYGAQRQAREEGAQLVAEVAQADDVGVQPTARSASGSVAMPVTVA